MLLYPAVTYWCCYSAEALWVTSAGGLDIHHKSQNNDDKKAMKIVDVVLIQVQRNSQVFHSFVSALEAAGLWTKETVFKLRNTYVSLLQPLQISPPKTGEAVNVGEEGW